MPRKPPLGPSSPRHKAKAQTPRQIASDMAERKVGTFDRNRSHRDTRRASEAADRLLRDLDEVLGHKPSGGK